MVVIGHLLSGGGGTESQPVSDLQLALGDCFRPFPPASMTDACPLLLSGSYVASTNRETHENLQH
jgi:hypothetical protein